MSQLTTIPNQLYVGLRPEKDDIPLGYAAPITDDSADSKRRESIDSWAGTTLQPMIVDNEPCHGFKIIKHFSRGGRTNTSVFRVDDPRGFQLEITGDNLMSVIASSEIVDGKIQSKCVWGRLRASNILIPEDSPQYTEAVSTSKRVLSLISAKDLVPGDHVQNKTGEEYIYLGTYHFLYSDTKRRRMGYGRPNEYTEVGLTLSKRRQLFATVDDLVKYGLEGTLTPVIRPVEPKRHGILSHYVYTPHSQYSGMRAIVHSNMPITNVITHNHTAINPLDVIRIVNGLNRYQREHILGFQFIIAIDVKPFGVPKLEVRPFAEDEDVRPPLTVIRKTTNGFEIQPVPFQTDPNPAIIALQFPAGDAFAYPTKMCAVSSHGRMAAYDPSAVDGLLKLQAKTVNGTFDIEIFP